MTKNYHEALNIQYRIRTKPLAISVPTRYSTSVHYYVPIDSICENSYVRSSDSSAHALIARTFVESYVLR